MRTASLLFLSFFVGLTACATKAKRPENVPLSAIFSGGIKGGSWLQCTQSAAIFNCEVYNYTGRLYESGEFEFANNVPKCFPSFIVSDYRMNGGYMVPRNVKQFGSKLRILRKNEALSLESAIKAQFPKSELEIIFLDDCQNGHYSVNFGEGIRKSGRIWAGEFFQVFE